MVKQLFIGSFILLYLGIGIVSTVHSYEFFQLANLSWMAITLAICFEIGQAATLFSIFNNADTTSAGGTLKRSEKIIPWILMVVLTLVQIFGNLYSSYRYLDINNGDNVPYFAIPVLSVMGIDIENKQTVQIIISYIMGAILPILALLLTAMVDSFMKRPTKEKKEEKTWDQTQAKFSEPTDGAQPSESGPITDLGVQTIDEDLSVEKEIEPQEPLKEETPKDEKIELEEVEPIAEPIPVPVEEPSYRRELIRNNGITVKR